MPVTEPVRLFWPEGTEEETAAGTERPPIWAAAQRAFEDGRLKPLPRMPTVRPESVYEMNLPESGT